jgi:hypothetical protein
MSKSKDLENSLPARQQRVQNKIFFRLHSSYFSFFQAMAEDYYKKGKIKAPTIGLLAKKCLMTAGGAWNRMTIQLMTQDFERRQRVEQERKQQEQHDHHQRHELGYRPDYFGSWKDTTFG